MQIKKIGLQPEDQYTIITNAILRDVRLSRRARGTLGEIMSHRDGYHVNAETLAASGPEGRDAMRAALNELIEHGYMRRVRHQDEAGHWRTDINVYIHGDAPAFVGQVKTEEAVADEDFDSPTPENPASVNQSLVHGGVIEDQSEDQSSISPSSGGRETAALPTEVPTSPSFSPPAEQSIEPASQDLGSDVTSPPAPADRGLPLVVQRRLGEMGVPITDRPDWEAAWRTATSLQWPEWAQMEAVNFPTEHLMRFLGKQRRRGARPAVDHWMRFYSEDRVERLAELAALRETAAVDHEDPAEREARQNRHLPPDRSGDLDFLDNTPEGQAMVAEAQRRTREARQAQTGAPQ